MSPALLARHWKLALSAVLLLALGVQTWRANHWHDKATTEAQGRKNDREGYKAAQKAAEAAQIAATKAVEARYSEEARKTDHDYQTRLAGIQDAADRYARANAFGVRSQAACRTPGGPGEGPVRGDPARGDGPGEDAVILSAADFRTLNENTARLAAVREWANGLIAAGLALSDQ